ncbi:MAG TPA: c-type cytochrome [Burkholderiaceae bacterium]|nr:c-type cytochrome [Burkholderiaceae bacterium]
MKSKLITMAVAVFAVAGCANPQRSRDLGNPNVDAKVLAQQVCSNCHGMTGNAVSPNFPNLAGQVEVYIKAQLNGFKSRDRRDPAGFEYMWGLSRSLSDAQIAGLAAYYAAQTPPHQPLEGTAAQIEVGRVLFESGVPEKSIPACTGCHGPSGSGQGAYPRLAGQHADYVVKQLTVFQRTNDRPEGAVMTVVAHELTQQNIVDVAAYVQSLGSAR